MSEYMDAVRKEIDKQLGSTDDDAEAGSWDYAVSTALGVVGPVLDGWDRRLSDVQAEHAKCLEVWDRQRKRLDGDRALLRWLHAEAVWWSEHRLEVGDRLGWRLVEAQEEVRALKAAIADIDAHATPVGLLHNDDPEGSPHHYLLTVGALHRALGKAYTAEPCESERARLRVEVERLRREVEFEAFGADTFSGADARHDSGPQCAVHPDGGTE